MRNIIQHRPQWILLFIGSHTLDEIATYWNDYLISTRYIRLTYLETTEAEELIKHPVPNFPAIYLPETVARIIYWTRCQPYLVQLVCLELIDYLNRKYPENPQEAKATPQDIENIIPKALETGSTYFNEFWDITLNSEQQDVIRNMIQKIPPTAKDRKIWRKLMEKEILQSDREGQVSFQVPLIERSIRKKIAEYNGEIDENVI